MMQRAKVISSEEDVVLVEIEGAGGCEGCAQQMGCKQCDKMISVRAENCCKARTGDLVELSTDTSKVLFYTASVFIMPLVGAFCGYFLGELLFERQIFSVLCAVLLPALTFAVLRFTLNNRAKKECVYRAVRIVEQSMEEQ